MSFSESVESLVSFASSIPGALISRTDSAVSILLAKPSGNDPNELLPIAEAASIAKVSKRTLREAGGRGEIPLFGKERTRTVKRCDLLAWIESRKVPVERGADDADMDARVARMAHARAVKAAKREQSEGEAA